MNDLTREIVWEVAREKFHLAQANDYLFFAAVKDTHWLRMMELFGFGYQERAFELARIFWPEMFDAEGNYCNYDARFAQLEIQLGSCAARVLNWKIRTDARYTLESWDAILPEIVAQIERERNPQMRLF